MERRIKLAVIHSYACVCMQFRSWQIEIIVRFVYMRTENNTECLCGIILSYSKRVSLFWSTFWRCCVQGWDTWAVTQKTARFFNSKLTWI